MPVAINLFAQQFGWMLVVAKDKKRDRSGSLMWLCYCRRCGGKKIVSSDCLRRGESSSCGCYHREVARETHTRHGYYQHAIHTTWRGMRDRCFNERSKYFPRYGGRGVQVCAQWDRSFEAIHPEAAPERTNGIRRSGGIGCSRARNLCAFPDSASSGQFPVPARQRWNGCYLAHLIDRPAERCFSYVAVQHGARPKLLTGPMVKNDIRRITYRQIFPTALNVCQ